jgi:hypothetical protein
MAHFLEKVLEGQYLYFDIGISLEDMQGLNSMTSADGTLQAVESKTDVFSLERNSQRTHNLKRLMDQVHPNVAFCS